MYPAAEFDHIYTAMNLQQNTIVGGIYGLLVGDALGWGGGLEHAFSVAVTVWAGSTAQRGACPAALRLALVCREDWSADAIAVALLAVAPVGSSGSMRLPT